MSEPTTGRITVAEMFEWLDEIAEQGNSDNFTDLDAYDALMADAIAARLRAAEGRT